MNKQFENIATCVWEFGKYKPFKTVISKTRGNTEFKRIVVEQKNEHYQISKFTEKQVFHENTDIEGMLDFIAYALEHDFLQLNAWSEVAEISINVTKKGKIFMGISKAREMVLIKHDNAHNRQKNYLLEEGTEIKPLIDMGIFSKEGKIVSSMYDKYKQINRFIEIIDDEIRKGNYEKLNIIDFGCGKSYLTFIVYYYLTEMRGIDAHIIGLDLKADVIKKCNEAALKYGYNNLKFELGDINGFKAPFDVDMVITLHACDTATDYALYNAIQWNAKMIFSVPCCQHELNAQMAPKNLSILKEYGIISERFCALATDAIRAELLKYSGYNTQILEFVDLEHTPKNLLIRAVKNDGMSKERREKAIGEVRKLTDEFGFKPSLYEMICS
ncbi:MAG: SAM-dependent methyltransferase [Lachnospiraceae bacterium]|nr:SAM-dependent methyltransferase [Lachnospiraceae bacterium]